jgi:methylated-DNA-[protein]-cysteine S-methyltransferase
VTDGLRPPGRAPARPGAAAPRPAGVLHWRMVETPLGAVFVAATDRAVDLIRVDVPADRSPAELAGRDPDALAHGGGLADEAARLVEAYFAGDFSAMDLPVAGGGETPFEAAVRRVVAGIPAGQTMTYGEVAALAGHPRAARAVGNVMRKNRQWLAIPCHRVVASDGLGGYGGRPDIKRALLGMEGAAAADR